MLDSFVKPYIEKYVTQVGKNLHGNKFTATQITLGGFVVGVLASFCAGMQAYGIGLILMLANRASDVLDDAVADAGTRTAFGTYMNAITNIVFFGLVIFMFGIGQGQGTAAAFVIFSFMSMTATHYASIILGNDQKPQTAGKVSFAPGSVVEGTEITIYLALIFLLPGMFAPISMLFGLLCWVTAFGRIFATMQELKIAPPVHKEGDASALNNNDDESEDDLTE